MNMRFTDNRRPYILKHDPKIKFMKNNKQQIPDHNTKLNNNKHRPENKDNMDSREREEQQLKGDDITHKRKEKKSLKKSTS